MEIKEELYVNIDDSSFPVIIAISGKLGSGKDEIGKIVMDHYPMFKKRLFALRVKKTVAALTNTTLEMNMTQEGKAYIPPGFNHSLGRLQQIVGDGLKPLLGDDLWANCLIEDKDLPLFTVIIDLRHKVEANKIMTKKNHLLIRVNGDPVKIREENKAKRDLKHISETDLDDWNFEIIIENKDITIEELTFKVLCIVDPFMVNILKLSEVEIII